MVDPDKNNQDNAPVEDSDDTKTRKTVRLRPSVTPAGINLTPLPKAPLTDPLSGRDTDTGNLEVMEDTQTRRTVKLKPIATQTAGPSIKPAIPIVGQAGGRRRQHADSQDHRSQADRGFARERQDQWSGRRGSVRLRRHQDPQDRAPAAGRASLRAGVKIAGRTPSPSSTAAIRSRLPVRRGPA